MTPDRQRALMEAMAAVSALAETGSREVAMDHLRRAHEILADAQHDERPWSRLVEVKERRTA